MADIVRVSHREAEFEFEVLDECSVSDHLREKGTFYELEFLDGLASLLDPSTLVLDVGAHIGNHSIFLAGVLGLRVRAFEPNPDAFALLERNVRINGLEDQVTCVQAALSSKAGHAAMTRVVENDAGTMSMTAHQGANVIRVKTLRLDDLELPTRRPIYIKLDVEGHESEVIRGGRRLLEEGAPDLSVEIQNVDSLDEILDLLGSKYVPRDLFNATPTVLLRPSDASTSNSHQVHMARYAVRNALDYSRRRNWYVSEKARAERLQERTEQLQERTEQLQERTEQLQLAADTLQAENARLRLTERTLEAVGQWLIETDLGHDTEWLRTIQTSLKSAKRSDTRALIVSFGSPDMPASVASLMLSAVDLVDCDAESGQPTRLRRFAGGRCVLDVTERFGLGELGAARVSILVEDGDAEFGPVDSAALIGGERSPHLEEAFRSLLRCPYLIVSHDAQYHFSRLAVLTGAARVFLSDAAQLEDWSRSQIVPAEWLDMSPLAIADQLSQVGQTDLLPATKPESSEMDSRILIVSYYAPPATPVSVQRLAYWHRQLPAIASDGDIKMEVAWLTATYRAAGTPGMVVVPDRGAYEISGRWFELYTRARDLGLDALGISWSHYIEQAIDELDGPYSTVVLSGNPFHYFALGDLFRKSWGSKVILDFRDPFAYNPRFKFTDDQRVFARQLEADWVRHADAVVSVNQECLDTVAPHVETRRHVVANGFDEAVVNGLDASVRQAHQPLRVAYSGTVFPNLPLGNVLDSLPADRLVLHHFGRDYSATQDVTRHPNAVARGLVSYVTLIQELRDCVAGIIMTSGEASTQTTKLFDYLACDLDIIIVTSGRPRTGNLHEMTRNLEGVFWVENNERDLRQFFLGYKPTLTTRPEREMFSRRDQTRSLFELIRELEAS